MHLIVKELNDATKVKKIGDIIQYIDIIFKKLSQNETTFCKNSFYKALSLNS